MKAIFADFSNTVEKIVPDSSLRSRIIASAVALAATNQSSLPSSPVESPSNHFNMTILPELRNIISDFNENAIFDCKMAIELSRSLWLVRYSAAYPGSRPCYAPSPNFFEAISCVGTYVAKDILCFLNDNSGPILALSSAATSIICSSRE